MVLNLSTLGRLNKCERLELNELGSEPINEHNETDNLTYLLNNMLGTSIHILCFITTTLNIRLVKRYGLNNKNYLYSILFNLGTFY